MQLLPILHLKNFYHGLFSARNTHKVKGHPSLQKGGSHEAYDIEDLVKIGEVVKGCSLDNISGILVPCAPQNSKVSAKFQVVHTLQRVQW